MQDGMTNEGSGSSVANVINTVVPVVVSLSLGGLGTMLFQLQASISELKTQTSVVSEQLRLSSQVTKDRLEMEAKRNDVQDQQIMKMTGVPFWKN